MGSDSSPAREIPLRPLPYGSEGVISPTYVAHAPADGGGAASTANPDTTMEEPSYTGPGVVWEKDEQFPTKETPMKPSEEELDVLDN